VGFNVIGHRTFGIVYGDDEDKAKEIFLFVRKVYPVKIPPAFITVQLEKYPILAR